ncbi:hypothetical protein NDW01_31395 [Actinoallomurus sp. WRP6H-15]|nr:hypothetical protein [Actinoallomurus soli]
MGWLELLPFRRGVTLIAVLIIVPAFIIGGLFAVRGGGGHDDPSRSQAAAATPSARAHGDSGTVAQTERAFGEIVASRSVHPTARSSASASPSHTPTRGTTSRTRPTPSTRPSPSANTKCPPELKKWPWMWDLCKHRRGGHTTP